MPDLNLKPGIDNYCVAGNPVAHSKSPRIHAEFARQTGQQMFYQAIHVAQDGFADFLEAFRDQGGKGLSITLPFKEQAWQLSTELTDRARDACAVNTIDIGPAGTLRGDNTDGAGLLHDLVENHGIQIAQQHVLVLGAGGAARGIIGNLLSQQPARLVVANRTISKAEELVQRFVNAGNILACRYRDLDSQPFQLIINATSASLQGEVPPVPPHVLGADSCCYDLMYADTETAFLDWARQHGSSCCIDGLGMLVEQAAEAFFLWRGVRPETAPVLAILRA